MEITSQEKKQKALDLLNQQPDNFRWGDILLSKENLIKLVSADSQNIINMVNSYPDLANTEPGIFLGKRYKCLVCGTEAMCIIKGSGKLECCGQRIVVMEPKSIPSSD